MKIIPKDPVMCMSFLNTQLRDFYKDLDSLCEDFEIDKEELVTRLDQAGFTYQKKVNQFR